MGEKYINKSPQQLPLCYNNYYQLFPIYIIIVTHARTKKSIKDEHSRSFPEVEEPPTEPCLFPVPVFGFKRGPCVWVGRLFCGGGLPPLRGVTWPVGPFVTTSGTFLGQSWFSPSLNMGCVLHGSGRMVHSSLFLSAAVVAHVWRNARSSQSTWFKRRLENGENNLKQNRVKEERYLIGKKEMFYLTTHSTHFIYGYMASDIW